MCLATLEGAEHAIAFASGMAAITTLALTLKSGDRVVIPDDGYGGTHRLFSKVMADLGIDFDAVDMTDLDVTAKSLEAGAALVLGEAPTNPLMKILDLTELARLSHEAGAMFVVDNTFATPYIQRPLEMGADAVVYSATKYLGGHSDIISGSVATSDDSLAERLRFLQNAAGAVPGPFDCWLELRGLKTLSLRMRAHSENALRIARFLEGHEGVERVYYPGLESHPGHELATKQMSAAGEPLYGGMIAIDLDSEERALEVCRQTKLFFLAESLGGVESLIEHPGRMTHMSVAESEVAVPDSLLRISVGIEHADDLIADLEQALAG